MHSRSRTLLLQRTSHLHPQTVLVPVTIRMGERGVERSVRQSVSLPSSSGILLLSYTDLGKGSCITALDFDFSILRFHFSVSFLLLRLFHTTSFTNVG